MQTTKNSGLVGFGLMVALFFAAAPAVAQERQDFPNDDRSQLENQAADSHGSVIRERENQRDSLAIKALIAVPVKPKESKKKEEETLSYNFLYYIIQKFKGSDVVD